MQLEAAAADTAATAARAYRGGAKLRRRQAEMEGTIDLQGRDYLSIPIIKRRSREVIVDIPCGLPTDSPILTEGLQFRDDPAEEPLLKEPEVAAKPEQDNNKKKKKKTSTSDRRRSSRVEKADSSEALQQIQDELKKKKMLVKSSPSSQTLSSRQKIERMARPRKRLSRPRNSSNPCLQLGRVTPTSTTNVAHQLVVSRSKTCSSLDQSASKQLTNNIRQNRNQLRPISMQFGDFGLKKDKYKHVQPRGKVCGPKWGKDAGY